MTNVERINELTIEVERFLKQKGTKAEYGGYVINTDYFLETLLMVENLYTTHNGISQFNFLNSRINKKFYDICHRMKDLATIEEIYSDVYTLIVEELSNQTEVFIRFDNYKRNRDDISRIVFRMDKDIPQEILKRNDISYNRNSDDKESSKYFKQFGNVLWLDSTTEEVDTTISEVISSEDVIAAKSNTESELNELNRLVNSIGLTARQEEVLELLVINNGNQSKTAKELGVRVNTVHEMINRIREKFDNHYKENKKITKIDELVGKINRNDGIMDIADFIMANIDDEVISCIVYDNESIEYRAELVRCIKGKPYNNTKLCLFVSEIIEDIRKQYK